MKFPLSSASLAKVLSQSKVKAHTYRKDIDKYTRRQGDQGSYIDYFLSVRTNLDKISEAEPIEREI